MTVDLRSARQRAADVIEEFALFDDWMGRYEHLIEQGRALADLDPAYRRDEYRVSGCQSQVWLAAELKAGRVHFRADSDAMITKGLIALLVRVYGDLPPAEILGADLSWLDDIGMREHLSATRKNGLDAMLKRMTQYAEAFAPEAAAGGTHE